MEKSRVLAALSALAHDTRLEIVRLLSSRGGEGMCAGGIARHLGLSASALSFHLSALDSAGLVRVNREGRNMRYRLNHAELGRVFAYVLSDCCGNHPDIQGRCCLGGEDDSAPWGHSGMSNT